MSDSDEKLPHPQTGLPRPQASTVWASLTDAQKTVLELARPASESGVGTVFKSGRLRTAKSLAERELPLVEEIAPQTNRYARTSWGDAVVSDEVVRDLVGAEDRDPPSPQNQDWGVRTQTPRPEGQRYALLVDGVVMLSMAELRELMRYDTKTPRPAQDADALGGLVELGLLRHWGLGLYGQTPWGASAAARAITNGFVTGKIGSGGR